VSDNKKLEKMILTCIDTAQAMLNEYELVIPFGIRAYHDSDDLKMNCPGEDQPDTDWNEQINRVVKELKEFVVNERIFATALVTELESEGASGLGLQVESELSSVLFIYPFKKVGGEWLIDEPIQTDQLLTTVF